MAKRKRLTPPRSDYLEGRTRPAGADVIASPPIAQVVGESAEAATLRELADTVAAARAEGRLLQLLPLDQVDAGYLVRDRVAVDAEEQTALVESLRARGQQTAIEVVALERDQYGLISGWRRLQALRQLHEETGDARFSQVLARITRPESASDAYLAMVEENEIRVGLSYYERARIVVKAVDAGVFPHEREALTTLYETATRSRRSKIKSFIPLVRTLDARLRFPTEIGERLGLELSRRMAEDSGFSELVASALEDACVANAGAEQTVLKQSLTRKSESKSARPKPMPDTFAATTAPALSEALDAAPIMLDYRAEDNLVQLTGPGVTEAFQVELRAWLKTRNP